MIDCRKDTVTTFHTIPANPPEGEGGTGDPRVRRQSNHRHTQTRRSCGDEQERSAREPTTDPAGEHASGQAPGRAAEAEQPEAHRTEPEPLLGEEHEDGLACHEAEVHRAGHGGERSEEPVMPEPGQALADLQAERSTLGSVGAQWSGRGPDEDHDQRAGGEGHASPRNGTALVIA